MATQGQKDLSKLLESLQPHLSDERYVFCTVPKCQYGDYAEAKPIASFQQPQGLTLVLTQSKADQLALQYEGVFQCIGLQVHSSLEAVGLTAAVSRELSECGISANIMAAFFHDYIFVPQKRAKEALALIGSLGKQQPS